MARAGLLTRPRRGFLQITERGQQTLRGRHGERIDNYVPAGFEEFRSFKSRAGSPRLGPLDESPVVLPTDSPSTPLETIEASMQEANAAVASQLLDQITERDPVFLEWLVPRVLSKIGYGRGDGVAQQVGRSRNGGIGGVISQDALGLDAVCDAVAVTQALTARVRVSPRHAKQANIARCFGRRSYLDYAEQGSEEAYYDSLSSVAVALATSTDESYGLADMEAMFAGAVGISPNRTWAWTVLPAKVCYPLLESA